MHSSYSSNLNSLRFRGYSHPCRPEGSQQDVNGCVGIPVPLPATYSATISPVLALGRPVPAVVTYPAGEILVHFQEFPTGPSRPLTELLS